MIFAKLSKKVKADLVIRLREAARAANYNPSPYPSPHLSPRQNTAIPSPLPSPRGIPLLSPRPRLQIHKADEDIYDPLLLQCGGLSPHLDSFPISHSSSATLSATGPGGSNNGNGVPYLNNNISQARSMPASPITFSSPPQHHQMRYPPARSHQYSRSAHLSANDVSGLFDVTSFWDQSAPQSTDAMSTSLPPPTIRVPVHQQRTQPATARAPGSSQPRPVDSGLGIEEYYDIYADSEEDDRSQEAEWAQQQERAHQTALRHREDEHENTATKMSASFNGQQIIPDLMIHRAPTMEFQVKPPPRTRQELLELGWIREKGDTGPRPPRAVRSAGQLNMNRAGGMF